MPSLHDGNAASSEELTTGIQTTFLMGTGSTLAWHKPSSQGLSQSLPSMPCEGHACSAICPLRTPTHTQSGCAMLYLCR